MGREDLSSLSRYLVAISEEDNCQYKDLVCLVGLGMKMVWCE